MVSLKSYFALKDFWEREDTGPLAEILRHGELEPYAQKCLADFVDRETKTDIKLVPSRRRGAPSDPDRPVRLYRIGERIDNLAREWGKVEAAIEQIISEELVAGNKLSRSQAFEAYGIYKDEVMRRHDED